MVIVLTLQEYTETDDVTDVLILRLEQSKLSKNVILFDEYSFIYFFHSFLLIFINLNFFFYWSITK